MTNPPQSETEHAVIAAGKSRNKPSITSIDDMLRKARETDLKEISLVILALPEKIREDLRDDAQTILCERYYCEQLGLSYTKMNPGHLMRAMFYCALMNEQEK